MVNDLYEQFAQGAVDAAARVAFDKGMEVGFVQGFAAGQAVGFVAGVQSVQGALSDGTRKGSSQCARALESLKRLGATGDAE